MVKPVLSGKRPSAESPYWAAGAWEFIDFVVGTKVSTSINIALQFKTPNNDAVTERVAFEAYITTDPTGGNLAAAPTGGIAIGTNGLLMEPINDRSFQGVTDALGRADLTFTDSGNPTLYLVVVTPRCELVISPVIQF